MVILHQASRPPQAQGQLASLRTAGQSQVHSYTGKADQYVPIFDNQQKNYKEFRKRCELYKGKMDLSGRGRDTIFNIVTLLTGKAWDTIDDLSMEALQEDTGYQQVFDRLDRAFKYEAMTELPEDFETFFI